MSIAIEENVKVNVKALDGLFRELEVQVPADRFNQELEKNTKKSAEK